MLRISANCIRRNGRRRRSIAKIMVRHVSVGRTLDTQYVNTERKVRAAAQTVEHKMKVCEREKLETGNAAERHILTVD